MNQPKDYFSHKAKDYDRLKSIAQNAENIVDRMINKVPFTKSMHIMDFSSGTRLLLPNAAPYVGNITAGDVSSFMNDVVWGVERNVELVPLDHLTKETIDTKFDDVVNFLPNFIRF